MDVTFSAVIAMPSTCSIETQTKQVIVSPARNLRSVFVNASSKSEMATLHTHDHDGHSMEQSFEGSTVPDVTVPHVVQKSPLVLSLQCHQLTVSTFNWSQRLCRQCDTLSIQIVLLFHWILSSGVWGSPAGSRKTLAGPRRDTHRQGHWENVTGKLLVLSHGLRQLWRKASPSTSRWWWRTRKGFVYAFASVGFGAIHYTTYGWRWSF